MRFARLLCSCTLLFISTSSVSSAQNNDYENDRNFKNAWHSAETGKHWKDRYSDYRQANAISQNRCEECVSKAMLTAFEFHDYDLAKEAADVLMEMPVASQQSKANAAVYAGLSVLHEDLENADQNALLEAEQLYRKALKLQPDNWNACYQLGRILIPLRNVAEAKVLFHKTIALESTPETYRKRSKRFVEHPDWATLRMLPDFSITTIDGQTIDTESLYGKVVLFVFPRYYNTRLSLKDEPFPDLEKIAKDLKDEPFVMVDVFWGPYSDSVSKELKKHSLPWPQVIDPQSKLTRLFNPPPPLPAYVIADMRGVVLANVRAKSDVLENYLKQLIATDKRVLGSAQQ